MDAEQVQLTDFPFFSSYSAHARSLVSSRGCWVQSSSPKSWYRSSSCSVLSCCRCLDPSRWLGLLDWWRCFSGQSGGSASGRRHAGVVIATPRATDRRTKRRKGKTWHAQSRPRGLWVPSRSVRPLAPPRVSWALMVMAWIMEWQAVEVLMPHARESGIWMGNNLSFYFILFFLTCLVMVWIEYWYCTGRIKILFGCSRKQTN